MSKQADDNDFLRLWTTDPHGNRVLRGLTLEETEWYRDYQRRSLLPEAERKLRVEGEVEKFLQLYQKHESARALALDAETNCAIIRQSIEVARSRQKTIAPRNRCARHYALNTRRLTWSPIL